ncbi:MAG: hemolysin family protein [Beutenbergiaceae bacterium]
MMPPSTWPNLFAGSATSGPADGVPISPLVWLALGSLALAAVLSAGEEATRSITRSAAHEAQVAGVRGAATAVRIAENPSAPARIAALVRVLAEMAGAVCLTLVMVGLLDTWWQVLLGSIAVSALLMLLVVGSSPRSLGRRHPITVLATVGPLMLALARPWRAGSRQRDHESAAEGGDDGAEPLRHMVDRVSESDEIDDDERDMLRSIFELGSTMAREVMVPRTDMVTIPAGSALVKARNLFIRSGYSRIPVIGDGVDDLRGVLYLKDMLKYAAFRPDREDDPVDAVAREPVLVPETKPVDDLLEQMRSSGIHIAFAVDEWGGIAGLVTIEDILEELVGEVTDEHDPSEPDVVEGPDGSYLVPARMSLDELGELFDITIADDEVDTVTGLLAKALGKVPIAGSVAASHGLELAVQSTAGRRRQIDTVSVRRAPAAPDEESAS